MCSLLTAKQNSGSCSLCFEADLLQPALVTGIDLHDTYVKICSVHYSVAKAISIKLFLFRHLVLLSHWPPPVCGTWSWIHPCLIASLDLLIYFFLALLSWTTLVKCITRSKQNFILGFYFAQWFLWKLWYVEKSHYMWWHSIKHFVNHFYLIDLILFWYCSLFLQVIGTLTILLKQTKRTAKRKDIITVFELTSYIRNNALLLIGKGSHKPDRRVHTNVSIYTFILWIDEK